VGLSSFAIASDDFQEFTVGMDVNGLIGGFGWGFGGVSKGRKRRFRIDGDQSGRGSTTEAYVDNYPGIGLATGDDMESYGAGVSVNGLNGGTEWHTFFGSAYSDRYNFDFGAHDDMESYVAGNALNGLNGSSAASIPWGGAYVDR
jgi:hypothetical protein